VSGHRDHAVVAFDQPGEPGILKRHVEARCPLQRVDPRVAGHEDLVRGDVLAHQVLLVVGRRRVVHGGDAGDELAVELFRERREIRATGPEAGLDVPDGDPQVERRERGGERRLVSPWTSTVAGESPESTCSRVRSSPVTPGNLPRR
jgi:hypothetical protein